MTERRLEVIHMEGLMPYGPMFDRQVQRRDEVRRDTAPNTLFILEHEPVLTLGRDFHEENLLHTREQYAERGIAIEQTDRGGDVTYHGPGQLTAYPILNLNEWKLSIRWYLRSLEEVIIRTLAEFGIEGKRVEGFTGIWVEGAKVAQIGVAIKDWITYHGIALNVSCDMSLFTLIVPCGISDKPVINMEKLVNRPVDTGEVSMVFEDQFRNYFLSWTRNNDPVNHLIPSS